MSEEPLNVPERPDFRGPECLSRGELLHELMWRLIRLEERVRELEESE